MAYSDFNLTKLEQKFGITHTLIELFAKSIPFIEPSEHLKNDIEDAMDAPTFSEKAKSELLITPIIRELRKNNHKNFTFFSGYTFEVDAQNDLTGICDYLFSKAPKTVEIKAPVFCIVEAKNRAVEEGFGQCGAEMYAARIFNENSKNPTEVVFGAVTNAFEWIFLKLEGNTIFIDENLYVLQNLPQILGVLQTIVDFYQK